MFRVVCRGRIRGWRGWLGRRLAIRCKCHYVRPEMLRHCRGLPVNGFYDICTCRQLSGKLFFTPLLFSWESAFVNSGLMSSLCYSHCSISASTAACANATKTDRSALPIRNLPSRLRMIYLASRSWHDANSFVMIETFLAWDFGRDSWGRIISYIG